MNRRAYVGVNAFMTAAAPRVKERDDEGEAFEGEMRSPGLLLSGALVFHPC